jgi:7-carboxy-7-deazaguanine synthase
MSAQLPVIQGDLAAKWQRRVRPLEGAPEDSLVVHEIYASIQGEGTHVGLPCAFVRLTACHLRCSYCDTRQAFGHGSPKTLDAIVDEVMALGTPLCLITGGEPMLQANVLPLMATLCDRGMTVLLETSGSLPLTQVDARVVRIIDMKTPSSGEVLANDYTLLDALRPHDEVKFVIGDPADYAWAQEVVHKYGLVGRCAILFGPVFGALAPQDLVAWVLRDRLEVRVQVQLHKYIWDPSTQGV